MAGEDGDTQRRFDSNSYQSQKQSSHVPLKVKDNNSPSELLETSNRPLNGIVSGGVLDDEYDEEEEKKASPAGRSEHDAVYVSQHDSNAFLHCSID